MAGKCKEISREERDSAIDALLEESAECFWGEGCCEDVIEEEKGQ